MTVDLVMHLLRYVDRHAMDIPDRAQLTNRASTVKDHIRLKVTSLSSAPILANWLACAMPWHTKSRWSSMNGISATLQIEKQTVKTLKTKSLLSSMSK